MLRSLTKIFVLPVMLLVIGMHSLASYLRLLYYDVKGVRMGGVVGGMPLDRFRLPRLAELKKVEADLQAKVSAMKAQGLPEDNKDVVRLESAIEEIGMQIKAGNWR